MYTILTLGKKSYLLIKRKYKSSKKKYSCHIMKKFLEEVAREKHVLGEKGILKEKRGMEQYNFMLKGNHVS